MSRPKGGLSWRTATAVRNFSERLRLCYTLVRKAKFPAVQAYIQRVSRELRVGRGSPMGLYLKCKGKRIGSSDIYRENIKGFRKISRLKIFYQLTGTSDLYRDHFEEKVQNDYFIFLVENWPLLNIFANTMVYAYPLA